MNKSTEANSCSEFEQYFLTSSPISQACYRKAIRAAEKVLTDHFAVLSHPYSGKSIPELRENLQIEPDSFARVPTGLDTTIAQVGTHVVPHLINVNHPYCMAHLHCPPLIASAAAELIIGTTNQSMDSWDQSAAATLIEEQVVQWFCQQYGFGEAADGVFTSGGTQSNFMGMLLARNHAARHHFGWSISAQGLPPEGHKFRILYTEECHFSIRQAARLLGLGDQAVVCVPLDEQHRLQPDAVVQCCERLTAEGLIPIALVSTAGTTDFGTISPLGELADCAKALGLWFHVDAAFGSALMFSKHRHRLAGIECADSLTIDCHKLFYQSISSGLFLLKHPVHFDLMKLNADYLNPESNAENGLPDLVAKSVQTTRRFDALKIYMTLQAYGTEVIGQIVDTTLILAQQTAQLIDEADDFQLAGQPSLNSVVFRYRPAAFINQMLDEVSLDDFDQRVDTLNDRIRLTLLQTGEAVIGFTKVEGRSYLKFTLMNPLTTIDDIEQLLTRIRTLF
ncbi:MAG: aspartate aminotransferase family protein [Chloroflexota bacterium]